MKPKIHFITYGDSRKYTVSKKHILGLAKQSNFFDSCFGYSQNDLSLDFRLKYKNILKQERGGGYYLWKPWIIYNSLKNIRSNDFLVYADAGSTFNYFGKTRFYDYIEMLDVSDYGNLRFENPKNYIEKEWTSKELFKYFNIQLDSKIANSPQLMGGHIIFQKNKHTHEYLESFFEVVDYDENLITDYYSDSSIKGFQENRHDQSIFSLLSKKIGGVILENETFFEKNSKNQKEFPFLSVRHYGHGKIDRIKYFINYKNVNKSPIYF